MRVEGVGLTRLRYTSNLQDAREACRRVSHRENGDGPFLAVYDGGREVERRIFDCFAALGVLQANGWHEDGLASNRLLHEVTPLFPQLIWHPETVVADGGEAGSIGGDHEEAGALVAL